MDELCELGRGETFGTTPVASRAAIGTMGTAGTVLISLITQGSQV